MTKQNLPEGVDSDNPAPPLAIEPDPLTGAPDGATWSAEQLVALGHDPEKQFVVEGGTTYEVRDTDDGRTGYYWPGTDLLCAVDGVFV